MTINVEEWFTKDLTFLKGVVGEITAAPITSFEDEQRAAVWIPRRRTDIGRP